MAGLDMCWGGSANNGYFMTASATPVQNDIFQTLRTFLLGLITTDIIQGLPNRAAMPAGAFISMTSLFQTRLSTNVKGYSDTYTTVQGVKVYNGTKSVTQATEWTVQLDCYGESSQEWANIITTLFRDEYAAEAMAPKLQPLYADDPKQMPIVNGEQQYEQRWVITAKLQYNPVTVINQQFFDTAVVGIHDVDHETLHNN